MRPSSRFRLSLRKLLLWSAPLAWLGCGGGGGTDIVLPSLSVTTSTAGTELDADGYDLAVDGNPGRPIGLDATLIIEQLTEGAHSVSLGGVAANCTAADNPRGVTVQAGATATVAFAVTCGATSGTIQVATTTSGAGSDPDGYALIFDAADRGSIGVTATTSLAGLTPGPHSIGLTGLAANCQVVGDNPRNVMVTPGQTAQVSFEVTCAQPPPNSGSVRITTTSSGNPPDPDGYSVSVDGGPGQAILPGVSLIVPGLSVGAHTIELAGLAANCRVSGQNPRGVTVAQGQTAEVSFTITCAANTGGLTVTVSGLPSGTAAAVTVAGPNGYSRSITGTGAQLLADLAPGSYTVSAASVAAGAATYTGSVDRPSVTVAAGATAAVTVTYQVASGPTLNLRVDGLYLTQSIQTRAGRVPLVRDRNALVRVFVVANQSNSARPTLRVRFFRAGALVQTKTVTAPRSSTPTSADEGELNNSWNAEVEASLVQPDISVVADVDPGNTIAESNEGDNSFPASGTPQALSVQTAPPAAIRFVPVLQTANGLQGTVSNPSGLVETARRMYPLQSVQTDVHAVYSTSGPLEPENGNNQWNQILGEIEALRVTENSSRTYFGMVRLDYSSGIVGVGFIGNVSSGSPRAALGWDEPSDARRVVAHELGHTWGQLHTPCGDPPGIDPNYPYPTGNIGVYGYDVTSGTVEPPSSSDIMGYCPNAWVSDYTYQRVQAFRQSQPAGSAVAGSAVAGMVQPCLLVWGHIENGRPVLEPGFEIVTRPRLPSAPGPYAVEATGADGSSVFRLSFDATQVADDPRGNRHFAFAVPLDQARAAQLGNLRLSGPGGAVTASSRPAAQLQRAGRPSKVEARRDAAGVTVSWNTADHPMVMVRDPETGEVLSFARGGNSRVWTAKGEVDLEMSDGVKSQRLRLAISRR
jgi:hypothetical protein